MIDFNKSPKENLKVKRDQLITVQDLIDFKQQLIGDIKQMLRDQDISSGRQWLKSIEVKKMLRLSESSLIRLRNKGIIPFKKLGGITYYNADKIQSLMTSGKYHDHLKIV